MEVYSFHAPEVECIIYEGMRIAGLPEGLKSVMGWSGRASCPPASEAGRGHQDKEHACSDTQPATAVIGIDIGKNRFQWWATMRAALARVHLRRVKARPACFPRLRWQV